MVRVICVIIGYLCGLLQTGYLYGKLNHIDIRQHGSGNAGTTNALRTLGFKAGLITFLGDCLKTVLAAAIVYFIFHKTYDDMIVLLCFYAGMGCVLGHNFPFYLGFKGGKGIAATAGLILSFGCWQLTLIGFLTFVISVAITRYVSVGSLLLVWGFLVELIVFGQMGMYEVSAQYLPEIYAIGAFLTLLATWKHRANIKRLIHGTENKLGAKKKEEVSEK